MEIIITSYHKEQIKHRCYKDVAKNMEKQDHFQNCCKTVNLPVTRRQASKFCNKTGLAYKKGRLK